MRLEFLLPFNYLIDTMEHPAWNSCPIQTMFRPFIFLVPFVHFFVCGDSIVFSQENAPANSSAEGLWSSHVENLLQKNCPKCHSSKKKSGQLDLTSEETILAGGKKGQAVVAGKPDASLLFQLTQVGAKPHMPPGGKQLSEEELSILKTWIERLGPAKKATPRNTSNAKPALDKKSRQLLPQGVDPTTIIDLLIEEKWSRQKLKVASRADDRQFACRLYLDLVGRIPTPDELSEFQKDTRSNKRERLADHLLNSDEHAAYFASVLDTLLMGRGNSGQYRQRQSSGWNTFLKNAIQANRPWNEVVKDILLARPTDPKSRGSVWFLYERNNKHQEIAEAIAPAVFGIRIECAQCHDHPLAGEIEQRHYWGLVAFFKRGKNGNSKQGLQILESAIGGFEEFTDLSGKSYPNELVFLGKPVVAEKRPQSGKKQKDAKELYVTSKNPGAPRVPKFSRREKFVDQVLNGHPLVSRAMVNRIWASLMGSRPSF